MTPAMKVKYIGSLAREILSTDQEVHVQGISSKGVFIKTNSRWVVFLSLEGFRGPLTITLVKYAPFFAEISLSETAAVNSGAIHFQGAKIVLESQDAIIWQPPQPAARILEMAERQRYIAACEHELLVKKGGSGLEAILPQMFEPDRNIQLSGHILPPNLDEFMPIQQAIRASEMDELATMLSSLLGKGQGLTPAWDDFIVGLTLCLNRYQDSKLSRDNLEVFNRKIVEAAYKKTTTLSANLIESASLGLADERLIDMLDLMVSGIARNEHVIDRLLTWGHSSGVEAFYGMVIGISAR